METCKGDLVTGAQQTGLARASIHERKRSDKVRVVGINGEVDRQRCGWRIGLRGGRLGRVGSVARRPVSEGV